MSLLEATMETFVMIDKTTAPDGYGGFERVWVEGAEFLAAAVLNTSTEARVAAADGVLDRYTITTRRAVNLHYHDVVKRKSDSTVFRITSDGDDVKTPPPASLDMRQVTAEKWELPDE